MLIDTTYIKNKYQIKIDEDILIDSINNASAWAITKISREEENSTSVAESKYTLDLSPEYYFFDRSLDDEVDTTGVPTTFEDFTIFEVDEDYTKYDLLNNISNIKEFYIKGKHLLIINMDSTYPSVDDRTVYIKYRTSRLDYRSPNTEHKKQLLKVFIGQATVIDLLTNKRVALMQSGISSWNLNGVAVSLDDTGMDTLVKAYKIEMKGTYDSMMKVLTETIQSRYDWSFKRYKN